MIILIKYLLLIDELYQAKPDYFKTDISKIKDCYPFQTIRLFSSEFMAYSLDYN